MNKTLLHRTALVTGASSGIGEATALRLASLGITTYAAARRVEKMEPLRKQGIRVIGLDVTDEKSIKDCAGQVTEETGGIDILVNNAGYGSYGSIEEVPLAEARRQVEVNLFGLAALTQLVIPHMREQRWGKILNVTSIGGRMAFPYGGWYHTTKFAVEGLTASLRQELSPFEVDAILIRPGAIKTEWGGIAAESLLKVSGAGPYSAAVRKLHELFTGPQIETMAADPSVIADVIEKAITVRHPKSAYVAPFAGRMMLLVGKLAGSDRRRDALNRLLLKLPKKM